MKNKTVLVVILVVLVGAVWWYWMQSFDEPLPLTTTETPTQQNTSATNNSAVSTQTSATIDQSSLKTNSQTPTITGTYTHTGVVVVVAKGNIKMPTTRADNTISVVWADRSDHGGGVNTKTNGTYADMVGTPLGNGIYTVGIYNVNTGSGSETLLASGTLTINVDAPSATINEIPGTVQLNTHVTIAGTASNLTGSDQGGVTPLILGPNYTGATDVSALEQISLAGGGGNAVPVTNGQWADGSPSFSTPGRYTVFILDLTGKVVLATATFTVSN